MVLIYGETGTGKELLAHALHMESPRRKGEKDDIYLLVGHFMRQFARQYNKSIAKIDPQALQILSDYSWPGNVRELKNCIARSVILSKNSTITAEDLPQKITSTAGLADSQVDDALIRRLPEQGVTLRTWSAN